MNENAWKLAIHREQLSPCGDTHPYAIGEPQQISHMGEELSQDYSLTVNHSCHFSLLLPTLEHPRVLTSQDVSALRVIAFGHHDLLLLHLH